MVVVVFLVLLTFLSDYLMPSLSWICLVPRLVYPTLILNISQYILSTWQDDWNRAVVNKLQASPGRLAVLLRAVQEVCSCLVSCLHQSYIFDPFIHPRRILHLGVSTVSAFWQFATLWWSAIISLGQEMIFGRCGVVESFHFHRELVLKFVRDSEFYSNIPLMLLPDRWLWICGYWQY